MREDDAKLKDDFKLLSDAAKGCEDSFAQLLNRYKKPLINFIYRYTLNETEAEDIAQNVFLKIYKNASSIRPEAKFSTILYRIAVNASIDFLRKKKKRSFIISFMNLGKDPALGDDAIENTLADSPKNNPEIRLDTKERDISIKRALKKLPVNQRLAIVLRVYENKNYKEISSIMNLSRSSVESLLFRARQNLKKLTQLPQ